jgi:hypothetical protein
LTQNHCRFPRFLPSSNPPFISLPSPPTPRPPFAFELVFYSEHKITFNFFYFSPSHRLVHPKTNS